MDGPCDNEILDLRYDCDAETGYREWITTRILDDSFSRSFAPTDRLSSTPQQTYYRQFSTPEDLFDASTGRQDRSAISASKETSVTPSAQARPIAYNTVSPFPESSYPDEDPFQVMTDHQKWLETSASNTSSIGSFTPAQQVASRRQFALSQESSASGRLLCPWTRRHGHFCRARFKKRDRWLAHCIDILKDEKLLRNTSINRQHDVMFLCPFCPRIFNMEERFFIVGIELLRHLQSKHRLKFSKEGGTTLECALNAAESEFKQHCSIRGKSMEQLSREIKSFDCPLPSCGESFYDDPGLRRHLKFNHLKTALPQHVDRMAQASPSQLKELPGPDTEIEAVMQSPASAAKKAEYFLSGMDKGVNVSSSQGHAGRQEAKETATLVTLHGSVETTCAEMKPAEIAQTHGPKTLPIQDKMHNFAAKSTAVQPTNVDHEHLWLSWLLEKFRSLLFSDTTQKTIHWTCVSPPEYVRPERCIDT